MDSILALFNFIVLLAMDHGGDMKQAVKDEADMVKAAGKGLEGRDAMLFFSSGVGMFNADGKVHTEDEAVTSPHRQAPIRGMLVSATLP